MELCISSMELRKALEEIEAAEKNGFDYCLAVFKLQTAGHMLSDNTMGFSDLITRADPVDGNLDWGRFQNPYTTNRFDGKKLVPLK